MSQTFTSKVDVSLVALRKRESPFAMMEVGHAQEIMFAECADITNGLKNFKSPKVAVFSSGNELLDPSEKSQPGKIFDANRIVLLSYLKIFKFETIDLGIVRDDPDELFKVLLKALTTCDVVILTGGVSMGEFDIITDVLEQDFDANILFGRLNMKPGKPTKLAVYNDVSGKKLIFALPGNPVSAVVTFHLFALPALRKIRGDSTATPEQCLARITFSCSSDDRPEFQRGTLEVRETEEETDLPLVYSTGDQRSSRLSSMVGSNCLIYVPANKTVNMGDEVSVYKLPRKYYTPELSAFSSY